MSLQICGKMMIESAKSMNVVVINLSDSVLFSDRKIFFALDYLISNMRWTFWIELLNALEGFSFGLLV